MKIRYFVAVHVFVCSALLHSHAARAEAQQGPKLVGTGAVGMPQQGTSVALSADGNTAIVGGYSDNSSVQSAFTIVGTGAAWVWTRSGSVWTQQGTKLVGAGALGFAGQGDSVSLSADGNTAVVGGAGDNSGVGAAWVWTRNGGVWTQQGPKLVGSGATGVAVQGFSVSVSGDGNTAAVGGPGDNNNAGAAWIWTRSGGVWTQEGPKLAGSGGSGFAGQGYSVSLSADSNTAIVGGPGDNNNGAAWVWTRSGGVWTQQGAKLVGSGAVGSAAQGLSVALSGDGNTAVVGGPSDSNSAGAVWVWTRSGGVWNQEGSKLVGSGAAGTADQGYSVALSGDGNTALVGGHADNISVGAAWLWTRTAGVWTQAGNKLVGAGSTGAAAQGAAAALAADGKTAIVGGNHDNNLIGAAWVFLINPGSPASIPTASFWTLMAIAAVLGILGALRTRI